MGIKPGLGQYSYPFCLCPTVSYFFPPFLSSVPPFLSPSLPYSLLSLPPFPSPPFHPSLLLLSTLPFSFLPLLSLRMSEVAQTASKKPIRPGVRNLVLDMCCSDENGEDVDVPYIKYSF